MSDAQLPEDPRVAFRTLLEAGQPTAPLLHELSAKHAKTMRCNCDLDNWEPEHSTGHSWVCRIHKAAMGEVGL